jgi:hypothetical protein
MQKNDSELTDVDIEFCQEINIVLNSIDGDKKYIYAVRAIYDKLGINRAITDEKEAYNICHSFLLNLLSKGKYAESASLLWSNTKFSPEPFHCKEVFRCIEEYHRLIILGSSSSSKTYSAGVWFLLDWYRDPDYTKIYCISINAEHLVRNLFGHITDLFNSSAIKLKGKSIGDRYIGTDTKEGSIDKKNCGLMGVIFPQNYTASSGRMKGMKPGNRDEPHPVFGKMGRTRVLIDEAQNVPSSIFEDLPSVLAGANDIGSVKVIISGNPEEYALPLPFGYMSEPINGWESLDIDTDKEWESRYEYHVLRLDANDSENIRHNKVIYEGLQTPTGYRAIQALGGSKYMTFCRGIFPFSSAGNIVIPKHILMKHIGMLQWKSSYVKIASADIAFRQDKVVVTIGGYGKAIGIRNNDDTFIPFERNGKKFDRMALQIFNQFTIDNITDDIELARNLIRICKTYEIHPENFVSDSTGTGSGVYSYLRNYWGDTLGLMWGEGATEHKIFLEDEKMPEEKYYRISDEMWYSTREWVQNDAMWFSPNISNDLIFELTTRKQAETPTNGRLKVEPKDQYKKRNQGRSPDYSDSCVQLPQLVRMRFREIPSMSPEYADIKREIDEEFEGNITDTIYEADSLDLMNDEDDKEEDDNEFRW